LHKTRNTSQQPCACFGASSTSHKRQPPQLAVKAKSKEKGRVPVSLRAGIQVAPFSAHSQLGQWSAPEHNLLFLSAANLIQHCVCDKKMDIRV